MQAGGALPGLNPAGLTQKKSPETEDFLISFDPAY